MDSSLRLYNRLSIIIFSTFGSTFFGALLYAQNLKETNNGKHIAPTIIFSIIYSIAGFALSSRFGIEYYYSFIPIHLIGGLLLAFPLWNYHIKSNEPFTARKVWGPILVLLIPVAIIVFLNIYGSGDKLNAKDLQQETTAATLEAMENEIYVEEDSTFNFFDLSIPLVTSSYYFHTVVEDVNTVYNDIIWEQGYFRTICSRIPLSENEDFDESILKDNYDSVNFKDCPTKQFNSIICADYANNYGDTLMVYGEIALIELNRMVYYFSTQHYDLDKQYADELSIEIIKKIKLLHPGVK